MKNNVLLLLFALSVGSSLSAQWVLKSEQSEEYECVLLTTEEGVKKGRLDVGFTTRDTLLFDVRRTVKKNKKKWLIGYEVLKTYDLGLFRLEKPAHSPQFPVDKTGALESDHYLSARLSKLDRSIYDFLRHTLLPFPPEDLIEGYQWTAILGGSPFECSVTGGITQKLSRPCYSVRFKSEVHEMKGEVFWEENSGRLVYFEWSKNTSRCSGCYGNKYNLQLSLQSPAGLIAEKISAFEKADEKNNQLRKALEWVLPLVYDKIGSYSEGTDHRGYIVQQNGNYGWLDEIGRTIIPAVQDLVEGVHDRSRRIQVAKDGRIFLADSTGRVLVDSLDEKVWGSIVKKKGRWLVLDSQGKVQQTYPVSLYSSLSGPDDNGKIWATSGRFSGLIQGERIIIPVQYPFFRFVDDGIISVHKDSMAYLYDAEGKLLFSKKGKEIDFMFGDFVTISGEGLFNWKTHTLKYPTKDYLLMEYINDSLFLLKNTQQFTNMLFSKQAQELGKFKELRWNAPLNKTVENGLQLMIASDVETELYGVINFRGEWIVKPQYHAMYLLDAEMFAARLKRLTWPSDETVKVFRFTDKEVLPTGYEYAWRLSVGKWYLEHPSKGGVFDLKTASMTYLPQGLAFAQPLSYEDEAYLRVKKGEKMGLLDLNFKEVVPIEFEEVGPVTRYGVVVTADKKKGVIKRK